MVTIDGFDRNNAAVSARSCQIVDFLLRDLTRAAPQNHRGSAMNISSIARLLTRKEASEYLRALGLPCRVATLSRAAQEGSGPLITYFGRIPRYRISDLDNWVQQRLSSPSPRAISRQATADQQSRVDE
jgi:hypothetical protein